MNRASGLAARVAAALALLFLVLAALPAEEHPAAPPVRPQDDGSSGCLTCHAGIEPMHPEAALSCVDCHGGDATATLLLQAHVPAPSGARLTDERVAPEDRNLAWRQFRNPMDLRVADRTCGTCHEDLVRNLRVSLHGTTAGHLSDGFYEVGAVEERGGRYSVFPVDRAPRDGGEVERLSQVPAPRGRSGAEGLAAHYGDLPRKECMQCHLYSNGRAVRGRIGFDGDYRGEGCAACHVAYALDGLTRSADPTLPLSEPGHPRTHELSGAPTTQTCTSCHYGDASIGLHFRGLSQLPPDSPGGPDIPGTTDVQLNRTFYLNDPAIVPPDLHHERGMHCIDCHTAGDVMGDGRLHGQMEYAVEISCQACHGTFTSRSTLMTERGTPLEHLRRDGANVVLTSKVDGAEHVVPQAVDVVDPERPEYNERAAAAMTERHAKVECYTCHAGWNANFLGFHFSRNESLSQLDLLSGRRTPGRVTTQEKVFATWKSFYAGLNERGAVAPYLTGFSTMGSVWNEAGELVLDQELPVTAAGLSGLTMVHHQLHSTRPTARSCVECHRSSSTWGMGSPNFRLGRQLVYVADRRGIESLALDRAEPTRSAPLAKFVLPDVVALELECDPLQGHGRHLYAAEGGRGVHVLDVSNPLALRRVAFVPTVNPRGLRLAGDHLYVADGVGGLVILDVSNPEQPERVGHLPSFDAHDVELHWPWAYVADGPGGVMIVDVGAPIAPQFVSALDTNGASRLPNNATDLATLFQYSRPLAEGDRPLDVRTRARHLCAVMDRDRGLSLVDVTEPTHPRLLYPEPGDRTSASPVERAYRGLALLSQVDPAEAQGGDRTAERDYVYLLSESPRNGNVLAHVVDVSQPTSGRLRVRGNVAAGREAGQLAVVDFYNPPFRQRILFAPGEDGVFLADVTTSREPTQLGVLPGTDGAYAVAVESFPLDRMISPSGRPLKDISHAGSRWLYRAEIERLLSVDPGDLGLRDQEQAFESLGLTARLHLRRLDADGSGFLEGSEYDKAGGAVVDANGDGRISLFELAVAGGLVADEATGAGASAPLLAARVFPDGDLARLLDGVNPFEFDRNGDAQLDRRETERAMFSALDLDGDRRLDMAELSRHPGELRALRYGDEAARRLFRSRDKSRDGVVSEREFALAPAEWQALDADQDGWVRLVAPPYDYQRERGFVAGGSEWPGRRADLLPLPPGMTLERFLELFDDDGDGRITARELGPRRDLFRLMNRDGDEALDEGEIVRVLARADRGGVHVLPDDFAGRWDLDGDGRVTAEELPAGVRLRLGRYLDVR